jgi:hypothetical protein
MNKSICQHFKYLLIAERLAYPFIQFFMLRNSEPVADITIDEPGDAEIEGRFHTINLRSIGNMEAL